MQSLEALLFYDEIMILTANEYGIFLYMFRVPAYTCRFRIPSGRGRVASGEQ